MKLEEVLSFCNMLTDFTTIQRRIILPNNKEESDTDHSYMLAMMAWYIASKSDLGLDIDKVIKYALAHDLVEVYAGDSYIYDREMVADKLVREHAAAELLQRNFPDFNELHELIEDYEAREDDEARFIYVLDKILPVLVIYLGDGKTWKQNKISLEMLRQNKDDKIKEYAPLLKLWEELSERLNMQPELFPDL